MGFIDGQVDILFANETEILALTRTGDFEAAAQAIAGRVGIVSEYELFAYRMANDALRRVESGEVAGAAVLEMREAPGVS